MKCLEKDLEDVQREATRLVPNLSKMTYTERLKALNLPSLKHRRLRGDIIETFKYLNGAYAVKKPEFELDKKEHYATRGHSKVLKKHQLKKGKQHSYRNHFLTERIFDEWNKLPDSVVSAPSVNSFKARLDKHWKGRKDIFEPDCV